MGVTAREFAAGHAAAGALSQLTREREDLQLRDYDYAMTRVGLRVRAKETKGPVRRGDVGMIVRIEPAYIVRWPGGTPDGKHTPLDYYMPHQLETDLTFTSEPFGRAPLGMGVDAVKTALEKLAPNDVDQVLEWLKAQALRRSA